MGVTAVSVNSTKVNKIQFLRKDRYLHLSGSKITSHCLRVNLYADCEREKKKHLGRDWEGRKKTQARREERESMLTSTVNSHTVYVQ